MKRIMQSSLEYLFVICVVFYGQSVWGQLIFGENAKFIISYVVVFITMVLMVSEQQVSKRGIVVSLVLAFLLLLYGLLSRYSWKYYVNHLVVPLIVFVNYVSVLLKKRKLINVLYKFSGLIIALAGISLLCYFFGTILKIFPYSWDRYIWADRYVTTKNYFHLMYEAQTEIFFGRELIRNCGVFCEAPSYAVPLILSLFIECFLKKRVYIKNIAIISLAIITSWSTKALMIWSILLGLKVIEYMYFDKVNRANTSVIKFFGPIILLTLLTISFLVLDQKSGSNSFISRMDNINSCWITFKKHWFVGVGVGNELEISQHSSRLWGLDKGRFSIGTLVLLAEGGIFLSSIYFLGFVNMLKKSNKKYIVVAFGVIHALLLFSSNIPYFLSTIFILAVEYAYTDNSQII